MHAWRHGVESSAAGRGHEGEKIKERIKKKKKGFE
jgi:hypothetical protein